MTLDGASISKPTPISDIAHLPLQKPSRKPSKLRRYLSTRAPGQAMPDKPSPHVPLDATAPMQTLSPRPPSFEPWAKKHTKRSLSSFLLPKTTSSRPPDPPTIEFGDQVLSAAQGHLPVTENPGPTHSLPAAMLDGDGLESQGRLPVTANPYRPVQMQPRKDSATKLSNTVSGSPSRNAALTSHPVGKEDFESVSDAGGVWGAPQGRLFGEVSRHGELVGGEMTNEEK